MLRQFRKHYTRDEARALLPQIREWLAQLVQLRHRMAKLDQRMSKWLEEGRDVGGDTANELARLFAQSKRVLNEFNRREIQVKDLDRGLIDFPAIIGGREVFLCWEQDEEDVEYWHDLDAGYAGRERL
jgi:hypothetical protein